MPTHKNATSPIEQILEVTALSPQAIEYANCTSAEE